MNEVGIVTEELEGDDELERGALMKTGSSLGLSLEKVKEAASEGDCSGAVATLVQSIR